MISKKYISVVLGTVDGLIRHTFRFILIILSKYVN